MLLGFPLVFCLLCPGRHLLEHQTGLPAQSGRGEVVRRERIGLLTTLLCEAVQQLQPLLRPALQALPQGALGDPIKEGGPLLLEPP